MQTKIIYEDAQVIVCHKPAGLATQSGHVGQSDVVSELKKYLANGQGKASVEASYKKEEAKSVSGKVGKSGGAVPYLGVVHRLDQPVEGLLVFAKTKEAAAKLTAQLSQGSLNKQYYAVVCGKPTAKSQELVDYLIKDGNVARVSECGVPEAKKAILQYIVVREAQTADGEDFTLLDIHIDTGRFHQIRAQMSHAGLPLLGDSKYGNEQSLALGRKLGIRNVALYAYKVEFLHPVTGKKLEFSIEPKLPIE